MVLSAPGVISRLSMRRPVTCALSAGPQVDTLVGCLHLKQQTLTACKLDRNHNKTAG